MADPPAAEEKKCLFCQIVRGVEATEVVFTDDVSIAFLDHRPLFPGHTLLIPRHHFPTLMDLPPELVGQLFLNARLLAMAVETALAAEGVFVGINNRISQSVPHMHIHIVPRRRGDGLRGFFWPRHTYESENARQETAEHLRAAIERLLNDREMTS